MKLKGIDVSQWQGEIDWAKVKASGIGYAIIRAGFGNNDTRQDDTLFLNNIQGCINLGIPVGAYIYSYAKTIAEAKSEAEHILRLLQGYTLQYPVYLDLEDENTTGKLTNEQIEEIAKTFADIVAVAGYKVGIYANKYWWTTKLTGKVYDQWERWVAQYNSECTYSGSYGIWQYGSDGKVDGISGNVDVDICYKDYPSIIGGTSEDIPEAAPTEIFPDLTSYTGVSIAAALKECGYDNTYAYREHLAIVLGIEGYTGTAEQNLNMLALLGATVKANDSLQVGAAVRIKSGAVDLNTNNKFASFVYANTYTVLSMKDNYVVFGIGKTATGKVDAVNVTLA